MIYTNDIIKNKKNHITKIKKVIKMIYMPFVIVILLILLYTGYLKFIRNDNSISLFGYKQYIVITGSMEPTYNIGDLIIVKQVKENELNVGDVITFSIGDGLETISHRIINITIENGKKIFHTKGDNNNSSDIDHVEFDNIQGKIVYKISNLGFIITKLTTGTGIILVFLIVTLSYIRTNRKEEKRVAREDARRRFNKPKYT